MFCSEILADVVDAVVQIHGGYGFIQEYAAEGYYRDERINRIWEGTNEINRLLIPGIILKRAMKGEIPLQKEAMKAFESLMSPSFDELDDSVPFAAEKSLVANLKQAFLVLAGTGVQKFMNTIKDEQEILMAVADVAINIFAIESVILRAEKILPGLSDNRKASINAAVKVYTFNGSEKTASAARRAAYYIEEGDTLTMLLAGIRQVLPSTMHPVSSPPSGRWLLRPSRRKSIFSKAIYPLSKGTQRKGHSSCSSREKCRGETESGRLMRQHTVPTPYMVGDAHFYSTEIDGELGAVRYRAPRRRKHSTLLCTGDRPRPPQVRLHHPLPRGPLWPGGPYCGRSGAEISFHAGMPSSWSAHDERLGHLQALLVDAVSTKGSFRACERFSPRTRCFPNVSGAVR